jgi:BirA family biotin operon repressor/biotin-[acetyl-CoA-carboxylase] ligase
LVALEQTAGRGRRGNGWFSAPGESLTFSILLRPQEPKALWSRYALSTGLAVAEAIEQFGSSAGIKWPNDVWIAGRKVAGILLEAGDDFLVVGIGLNVGGMNFPEEIAQSSTSLELETGVSHPIPEVLAALIRRFAIHRDSVANSFASLIDEVRSRCVLTGHRVAFLTAKGSQTGLVLGITPSGEIEIEGEDGPQRLIQADEIRIVD